MKFFRHFLWIIAALAFAGWHWLQSHSTRPRLQTARERIGIAGGESQQH